MNKLDENLNPLIELNNIYFEEFSRTQHMIMKHDHNLQLQQFDTAF
jgi:hypothetical protein